MGVTRIAQLVVEGESVVYVKNPTANEVKTTSYSAVRHTVAA